VNTDIWQDIKVFYPLDYYRNSQYIKSLKGESRTTRYGINFIYFD